MTKEEVLKKVNEIFVDILDDDDVVLAESTVADDVEDWDSLTHIQIIVAVEKNFKVKFTASEIQSFVNVGDFCDRIISKL